MEFASGGELFNRICNAGRFSEDEVFIQQILSCFFVGSSDMMIINLHLIVLQARFFFQQLISGVSYCHAMVSKQTPLHLLSLKYCFGDTELVVEFDLMFYILS